MVRITPISKPFRPFGRGTTLLRDPDLLTMVINHLLTGMILQVPSGKLRWQMENEPTLKMYFPIESGNFPASYVS